MTKEEFTTQFNALISAQTLDTSALAELRSGIESDYDKISNAETTLTTSKETITKLTEEINKLKETNMKLFLMSGKETEHTDSTEKEELTKPESKPVDMKKLIATLMGKTEKE